ncbi:hypothetical protein LL972_12010 [Xanthomonas campestris pv. asclepiadis]|uniref:hypothetical protein n=1 Tax=Xanthomonas campestris TaxID=339 RepID=UPI001E3D896D|nr:hypothetical protein [Xanthomonas campestris]MCC4616713.1 hypothetical protein [Xanthomonas campestris pv. asclepiadis]
MSFNEAVEFERINEVTKAAECYERVLNECPKDLGAFINLLVLYWQSTDYGFSLSSRLPASFVLVAGNRLAEMLGDMPSNFSGEPEFNFWVKYIAWADLGGHFEVEECYEMMRRKSGYYEPAMFIYAATAGEQAVSEVDKLLELVRSQSTARERYIYSVVMGVKKRLS